MYRSLPDLLKSQKNWVCARSQRKVPLRADSLLAASVDNPNTWSTFEDAYANVQNGSCEFLGYVFDNHGIVGIDLDHSFEDGVLTDQAAEIINRCRSYTEISKSGEGIHILVKGHLPFTGSNNREGCEIYTTKRFFILTGQNVLYHEIIENQEAIDWLIQTRFQNIRVSENKAYKPSLYTMTPKYENGKITIEYPVIKEGSRNCCLTSFAGQLRHKGYSIDDIAEKTHELNARKCIPPLPKEEVDNIIRSIMKYNLGEVQYG